MVETQVNSIDFKLIFLNVWGIRDLSKRKAILYGIKKQKADITFLQETYSTPEIAENWQLQYKGKMFLSHGTNHSKGVAILVNSKLDFEAKSVIYNPDSRYILIDAMIQDSLLLLLNIYAPNDTSEQCTFFSNIS